MIKKIFIGLLSGIVSPSNHKKYMKYIKKYIKSACQCDCKKCHVCEKGYILNCSTCSCEKWKYLASIVDDSVWRSCYKVIRWRKKTIPTNSNENKRICKMQNFFYLHFH